MKGSLQIKNDKYYIVLSYVDPDGTSRRKWISTGLQVANNKLKAQKILEDYLKNDNFKYLENKTENTIDNEFNAFMTIDEFLSKWFELRKGNLAVSTQKGYHLVINKICGYFESKKIPIYKLQPRHIEEYYQYLRNRGLSGNTIIHHHVLLHKSLNYAYVNDLINVNPIDKVERPKKNKYHVATFYNKEDLRKMFDCFKGTAIEVPVYLAAFYGLRRSEVLGLRWSSVDFENKSILINHKIIEVFGDKEHKGLIKTNILKNDSSNRALPLFKQVEKLLKSVLEKRQKDMDYFGSSYDKNNLDYVCVNSMGELIKPNVLTQSFEHILKKNGLKHIRFHDLRHSCASAMLSEGVPMKQIQEWLGHSNFSTTADIYSHLDYSSKLESAKSVEKIFNFSHKDNNQEQEIMQIFREFGIKNVKELRKRLLNTK